jgi:ABC-type amino acid transport system permease subunit
MTTPKNTVPAASTAPATPAAPINQLSLWSMITGIASLTVGWVIPLPFGVAAVILGHIGLSQVKKTGEQGRTYALTGLVTGYVSIAIGIIAIVLIVLFFGALLLGALGYGYGYMPEFGGGMMFP